MLKNQSQHPNERYTEGGYTLIETMIAIAIFSIGFLAIASLQIAASKTNRAGSEYTQAATIATDRMERLMVLPFDDSDLDPAANPHPDPPDDMQGKYNIQWVVTEADLNADGTNDAKIVNMTVTWDRLENADGRSVNIDFVKPDI
jgi:prepilin-type N-terminal cleavage/methylation domain-containing protein